MVEYLAMDFTVLVPQQEVARHVARHTAKVDQDLGRIIAAQAAQQVHHGVPLE